MLFKVLLPLRHVYVLLYTNITVLLLYFNVYFKIFTFENFHNGRSFENGSELQRHKKRKTRSRTCSAEKKRQSFYVPALLRVWGQGCFFM